MEADIHTLYSADFYRVLDFKCRCTDCRTSKPEYADSFSISFVRKGNFLFNVFRNSLDSYTGCILVTKPGFERTVTHTHAIPDECTIFEFKRSFYPQLTEQYGKTKFFRDADIHSTLVNSTVDLDFLHFTILQHILSRSGSRLLADSLVMDVIMKTLNAVTDYQPNPRLNERLKRNHLQTIESARAYIMEHFTDDITLMEIAGHCHISPFHFSRIFKAFTAYSPHQYLLNMRLKHAELLLRTTSLPVADVAFSSGFNSIEYFNAAFRQQYQHPPARFREKVS